MPLFAAWSAAVLSLIYGGLTVWAGLAQIRLKRLPVWAAGLHAVFGLLTALGGLLTPFRLLPPMLPLWVLGVGLLGIHILALYNGRKLFGRIKPSHHLVRLLLSAALLGLAYLGLR